MSHVRPPAVAGQFYPADPGQLTRDLDHLLAEARRRVDSRPDLPPGVPKALVVPHAG